MSAPEGLDLAPHEGVNSSAPKNVEGLDSSAASGPVDIADAVSSTSPTTTLSTPASSLSAEYTRPVEDLAPHPCTVFCRCCLHNRILRGIYAVLLISAMYCGMSLAFAYTLPISMGAAFMWPFILVIGVGLTVVAPIVVCIRCSREDCRQACRVLPCQSNEYANQGIWEFSALFAWIPFWTVFLSMLLFARGTGEDTSSRGEWLPSIRSANGGMLFGSGLCGIMAMAIGSVLMYGLLRVIASLVQFCLDSYHDQRRQLVEGMQQAETV